MNYEELLNALQALNKEVKDSSAALLKLQKAVQKNSEAGNLPEVKKTLSSMQDTAGRLRVQLAGLQAELDSFDVQEYFVSGDFTKQLLEECRKRDVDVRGEKGVYEMFPFKVRVLGDGEHPAELYIDRKKLASFRPAFVAETISRSQARLYAANFKESAFMAELALAYEITCLRAGARIGSTQALAKIYKSMVPMARARRDYDMQAFAFDLARLYEAGPDAWVGKDGTRYTFGTSRDGANGIRVLSRTGVESFISTLRALNADNV